MLVQKDPNSAESQETHALALLSEAVSHNAIGSLIKAKECRENALAAYISACSLSSNPRLLFLSTGQLAHMLGDETTAITYYKLAHANVKDDPRAAFFLAQLAMTNERWGEGKEWITESLQRNPNEPFALVSLGLIEAELNNIKEAIALVNRGCAMLPDEPNLRFLQARVFRIAQQYDHAMEVLLQLPPDFRKSQMCQDELQLVLAESKAN